MIKLIYGPKGFGKTKIIKDDVNASAKTAKGNVVFITDKRSYSADIDLSVRCVYTEEYGVANAEAFAGFLNGLVAGNSDIERIFIDGILRITGAELAGLENLFSAIERLDKDGVAVELTVSADKSELPTFMLKYVA